MKIRELQKILNEYMSGLPESSDGEIYIAHGKKMYDVMAVDGFGVVLELTLRTGQKVFDWSDET